MNPSFIYFKEITFHDNKFILDFSSEEFVQKVNFDKNINYYIASLDYNLVLKDIIKKDEEKEIEELPQKSRLLNEKGAAYQNDIGWLTSDISQIYDVPMEGLTYNFVIQPRLFDDHWYKYKYFDTTEKKLKIVKFTLPFRSLRATVLNLKDFFHLDLKIIFQ